MEVTVSTFINPHLFWIVEDKSEERSQALNSLNKLMQDVYRNKQPDADDSFEVGEIVAVRNGKKYYRAIVEDIKSNNENNAFYFLCWLVDHGIMVDAESVYKLPAHIRKTKPLAMQACLNNVTYVVQHLTYDENSGQPVKVNSPTTVPTNRSHQVSLGLISVAESLRFKVENKVDGYLLGDILFGDKSGETKSLRQVLIDQDILMIDDKLFQEIQENIYNYKESHLTQIAQVCRQLNVRQHLEETEGNRTTQQIISKYLQEFDNRDIFDDEQELEPLSNHRSKSKSTMSSSNNTSSSEINISNGDISKNLKNIEHSNNSDGNLSGKKVNRAKLLLEKLKKLHSKSADKINDKENVLSDDSYSNAGSRENSTNAKKLDFSSSRDKDISGISVDTENTTSSDIGWSSEPASKRNKSLNSQKKKTPIPSNAIFVPGGACFTLNNPVKTSTPKMKKIPKRIEKSSSEESSSDCKTKIPTNMSTVDVKESTDEALPPTEEDNWGSSQALPDEPPERVGQLKIKPYCSCKQCELWTHEKDWQTSINFCDQHKEKHCLVAAKPQDLFKDDENGEGSRNIVCLEYSSMTKVQRQATPKLLVHGEYAPHPMKLISQVYFNTEIHKTLHQLEYREAKRIQIYSWPAILRYQHVCMISGPQTGKTMAYLPIMLTFLLEKNERYDQLLKASGPIFIVLCANTKKCEEVYDLAKILLGRNRAKVFLSTYPIKHVNTSHIDFLITTPPVLIDLLKTNAITFKRLCHLILEDGDKVLAHDSETVKIFSLIQNMLEHRVYPKPVQLIICAEHWNLRIERLLKRLNKTPLVCIGNYLEAALYGKVQFSMRFVTSACKEQELKNLLKETHKICKSVIVCNNEEVGDIQTILMLKGIDATVISEDLSKEDILYLEEVWTNCKGGQYSVLVCPDFLLNSLLTVTSANLLIHYSLPTSWSKFVKRFSCLLDNCRSPLDSKEAKMKCQSVVLCDEGCEGHMLKFFNYIDTTELKNQLPDKFKNFSKGLKYTEEEKKLKTEVGLCHTLKLLGSCSAPRCPLRHILDNAVDVLKHLPQSGKIKFKIVNFQDVTAYSIELIEHIDMDNVVHDFNDILDVTEDLTNTLKVSKKRIISPVVGHLYAYYDMDELDGVYYRCDLLELDEDCVKIKLIDKGTIIDTVKARLYRLPKEFKDKPRKIIDAYLANLIPPYKDENFSAKSFFHLKNLLEKHDYKNLTLTADVYLQLGNALWIKNVYQEIVLSDRTIPGLQLTREILNLKLVEHNTVQLINLYKLCKDASITLPAYEKQIVNVVKEERKVEPQWAHLDREEIIEVIFSSAVSPDEIYFRLNKFNHLLYTLQKEIHECLRRPNYPKLTDVEIGTICLAKGPDEEYSRAVIRNIQDDKALCFFVDFGDELVMNISELKHIHNNLISKLPFQSIQCRLHGLKPILNDWQSDIVDSLYEYATEPNTDIFRSLYIKSCGKEENIIMPKQNRYSVVLKDGFGEKRVLINNLLIDCGLAAPNSEEICNFEIPESSSEETESDEELEIIRDIYRKTEEVEENFCFSKSETKNEKTYTIDDEMELFLINPLEFFEEVLKSRKADSASTGNRELPAIQAVPPVDYYTPEAVWSQNEERVKIDIKLCDVEDYTLNLSKGRIMIFKTVKDEKTYILKLILYEQIDTVQHTSMGPHVRVTLTKVKKMEWPRLILSKQRVRNIHYDATSIDVTEERKKILELPKMFDESESEDDGEGPMYHVYSDMDSDMDLEMPQDSD